MRAHVSGDREVAEQFRSSGSAINAAAKRVLAEVGEDLRSRVRQSAGRFRRHSGRLQDRIKMKIFEGRKGMRVEVYPGVGYGYMLELGSRKNQVMRAAHVRGLSARDVRRSLREGSSRRQIAAKGVAFIKAHPVKVHLIARPFVEPVARGQAEPIKVRLQEAIASAIERFRGA